MFRKNTAGQFICVQMILTATGAVGTGLTPAGRRCLDGTFAAVTGTYTEDGSTGSYKFALSQADTNANDVSIITTATGCIPVCVNFVTTAADPTDSVRLGLTGLANATPGAAGGLFIAGTNAATTITTGLTTHFIGTVDTVTTYTGNTPQTGDNYARLGAPAGASVSADIVAINAKTTNLPAAPASTTNITAAALGATERSAIADAILDRDMSTGADSGSTTVRTPRQALRFLRNKWDIATGTLTVKKEDDSTTSWTAAMSTDAAAVPIIGSDPAG